MVHEAQVEKQSSKQANKPQSKKFFAVICTYIGTLDAVRLRDGKQGKGSLSQSGKCAASKSSFVSVWNYEVEQKGYGGSDDRRTETAFISKISDT